MSGFRQTLRKYCNNNKNFLWHSISISTPGQSKTNIDPYPVLGQSGDEDSKYYSPIFKIITEPYAQYEYHKNKIWYNFYCDINVDAKKPTHPANNNRIIIVSASDQNDIWGHGNTILSTSIEKNILKLTEIKINVQRLSSDKKCKAEANHPLYKKPESFVENKVGIRNSPERSKIKKRSNEKIERAVLRREVKMAELNDNYYGKPFHVLSLDDIKKAGTIVDEEYYETLSRMREYCKNRYP